MRHFRTLLAFCVVSVSEYIAPRHRCVIYQWISNKRSVLQIWSRTLWIYRIYEVSCNVKLNATPVMLIFFIGFWYNERERQWNLLWGTLLHAENNFRDTYLCRNVRNDIYVGNIFPTPSILYSSRNLYVSHIPYLNSSFLHDIPRAHVLTFVIKILNHTIHEQEYKPSAFRPYFDVKCPDGLGTEMC
jgi:hypothetical protein